VVEKVFIPSFPVGALVKHGQINAYGDEIQLPAKNIFLFAAGVKKLSVGHKSHL
jgi:hypothetical protein